MANRVADTICAGFQKWGDELGGELMGPRGWDGVEEGGGDGGHTSHFSHDPCKFSAQCKFVPFHYLNLVFQSCDYSQSM